MPKQLLSYFVLSLVNWLLVFMLKKVMYDQIEEGKKLQGISIIRKYVDARFVSLDKQFVILNFSR